MLVIVSISADTRGQAVEGVLIVSTMCASLNSRFHSSPELIYDLSTYLEPLVTNIAL